MSALSLLDSVALGIVEGVTEFIPVSSTGHLILASSLLGISGDVVETFEIFIQSGAMLAVVWLYWDRFRRFAAPQEGQPGGFQGKEGLVKLFVACLPAFALGPLAGTFIKSHLFAPVPVAWAMLIGALFIILVEKMPLIESPKALEAVTYRQCLLIGVAQCIALWPGMSRSAWTIIGGMLVGLDRKAAAEFSFLVAVPTIGAATVYDLARSYSWLTPDMLPAFAAGFAVSFIAALLAIKFFINLLGRFTLVPFALYRIIAGLVVLWWFI